MKLKTNISTLDRALGGGFEKGCNIALVGGMDNDHIIFAHQLIEAFLSQGEKILLVELRQDPMSLVKWLNKHEINYEDYIKSGHLKILDGFSNLYSPTNVVGPNVLPNPMDLGITSAIIRDNVSKEPYDIVVFDDITTLYSLQTDYKAYIRVMIRLINSLKKFGVSTIIGVNADAFPIQDLSMILMPFEYLLEVKNGVIKINRSFSFIRVNEFQYIKTNKGILPIEDVLKSTDHIRESLILTKDGKLMIGGERIQLISEQSERSLIEFVYQFLGSKEGKEFLYNWGRYEIRDVDFSRKITTTEEIREILESMFETTKLMGGGILKIVEIDEDIIIVEGKNLFPKFENFPYPAHPHYAGSMSKLLEKATGELWEGEEIKCEAQGSDKCVFVLRRVSTEKTV
ncbi:ATPase domain-containing protein [Pyrococcus abyssi]|uniref:4-vinyl reductase 4VR domain-containing protein n=1 Tax=Pyrococcus abyssi (strain GE5 / Orsay) TaxID=272844 RepID=Q9UZN4_PYRAB|nr:ATPase domain-containing protein [Pyrococcus abyssi]CAB50023.1 Hypothetical protein, containing vinyl 4 reductase domain [Pyrococcus abyssi GE5]CCE70526.1 TPA: hypothetical protein PAB0737 [Pyrococcus abyssi GE5]